MLIRHATTADTVALAKLLEQLGYPLGRDEVAANVHIYQKMQGYVFVAEEEEKVVAFISGIFIPQFHLREMMFRITALSVDESSRTKGVGRQLVQKIEELCRKNGCGSIELTSGAQRKNDAHVFYERLGFASYKGKRFIKKLK
jgi:GNAT superfamily N-acetyltransferase